MISFSSIGGSPINCTKHVPKSERAIMPNAMSSLQDGNGEPTQTFFMRAGIVLLAVFVYFSVMNIAEAAKQSAFEPGKDWPDNNGVHINAHGGGFLFHEGKYYWFGEHKIAGRGGNTAQVGVHVYSSADLYNWHDEGIALAVSDDPDSEITKGCIIERPKVIYNAKTKKFVMWMHLEHKGKGYSASRAAVSVADNVTGPYTFLKSYRPNAGLFPLNFTDADHARFEQWKKPDFRTLEPQPKDWYFGRFVRGFDMGQESRDMTVFVDDDGTAYHVHSSEENRTLHICKLTEDYTGYTNDFVRVLPGGANEAPAVVKHDGRYYILASGLTGWHPNDARYLVADKMFGPWTRMANPCVGKNPMTKLGANKTFGGQSTAIIPVQGKKDAYISVFDEWHPRNAIEGKYYFLPLYFESGKMIIPWKDKWDLSFFDRPPSIQNESTQH
ncbi:MAG: glycoside hydrolase family 43 protein [Tepidisphaeraceae bacterium]